MEGEGVREFLAPLDDDSGSDEELDAHVSEQDQKTAKRRHKALLEDLGRLSGKKKKRLKQAATSEPSQDVSEFHWSSGRDEKTKVNVEDLVGCLQNTAATSSLKKSLESFQKNVEVIDAPLPKHEVEQVQRTIAYQKTAERVSNWVPTVIKNRTAETISFPMNKYTPAAMSTKSIADSLKPRTSLEEEIAAVLNKAKPLLERKGKELSKHEEDALKTFDMQEAMQRRKELQKMRALQSYYEAKCKRIRKIKSKKFHRIQRKAETKKAVADLEKLAETNPDLLLSETEKAENLRALERANLRHRNTSKWAKNLIIKGKSKSAKDREAITEQLRISRALTNQKTGDNSDNDDEEGDNVDENSESDGLKLLTLADDGNSDNPWLLNNARKTTEEEEPDERLVRLKPVVNVAKERDTEGNSEDNAQKSDDEWDRDGNEAAKKQPKSKKSTKKKQQKKQKKKKCPDEEDLGSDREYDGLNKTETTEKQTGQGQDSASKPQTSKPVKQPNQKKELRAQMNTTVLPVAPDSDDEISDAEVDDEQVMTIREAFANDDVIREFLDEKKATAEKDNGKDVSLVLPGWGEWVGKDIKVSKKKRRKYTIRKKSQIRKDDAIVNVIINEERNAKFIKKQVSTVPFPFVKAEHFEKSIRQPIGKDWNTPSALTKMTQPRVDRLMGTIIDPIKMTKSVKQGKAAE